MPEAMVSLKRVYEEPGPQDGTRVLVDRLWPRGLAKDKAKLDHWEKELAPSEELRRWFGHDPEKWQEFRKRYLGELERKQEQLDGLRHLAGRGRLTLLYAAKDEAHNNAVVLKEILDDSSIG